MILQWRQFQFGGFNLRQSRLSGVYIWFDQGQSGVVTTRHKLLFMGVG